MDLIPIPGAEVYYDDRFLLPEEATQLFNTLLSKCAWERHRASFGHTVPRDEAFGNGRLRSKWWLNRGIARTSASP